MNKIRTMKHTKFFTITAISLLAVSCGKPEASNEATTFYKKDNVSEKKLEVTIEASGIICYCISRN